MVTTAIESVREQHRSLREHVDHMGAAAREIPALSPEERIQLVRRIREFLEQTLVPQSREEEATLYPRVARILGDARAVAPMVADHRAIRERIDRLGLVDPDETETVQELLYSLHVLVAEHLRKDDELYLPLLEEALAPGYDAGPVLEHEP